MVRGQADVVVVAAGTSERFGSDKLEAMIGGRPLLAWTLDGLAASELV
ncbi:MAG: NTP transferase domain-containing protein, partial [Chloroflexota bacterium]